MNDQGIVLGPSLGQEDPDHGLLIEGVGPQAVYRLTDDTLTNITTGSAMALTREQSAALSALLAPEAADNP